MDVQEARQLLHHPASMGQALRLVLGPENKKCLKKQHFTPAISIFVGTSGMPRLPGDFPAPIHSHLFASIFSTDLDLLNLSEQVKSIHLFKDWWKKHHIFRLSQHTNSPAGRARPLSPSFRRPGSRSVAIDHR